MVANRQEKLDSKNKRDIAQTTNRTSIIVAVVAATTALASVLFTYYFTDRVRTQISVQTLALETIKVEISKAAQQTANNAVAIDAARLELLKQATQFDETRLVLQKQATNIDGARFNLQRQIAVTTNHNDSKITEIEDKRRKADEIRLASELSKAKSELIPVLAFNCSTEKFTLRLVKIHCNFKNNGLHKISITPEKYNLVDSITQKIVDDAIDKVENADQNWLPAGVTGSNTYDVYLTEKGDKLKNRTISVKVKAQTDELVVDELRKIADGKINEATFGSLPFY